MARTRSAVKKTAVISAPPADPGESAIYEVLTPFKFRGLIVKPPEWIELGANEAKPYQAAGVLGTEPGEVPTDDDESGTGED